MKPERIERGLWTLARMAGVLALAVASASAQTHKVAKPETVVRAVGVYEWTGDMTKPAASRLIPITLFIDGKFEDAAVYLARPVPFALATGNVYQLEKAGLVKGNLDLVFSRHFVAAETSGSAYDDGWFGYGKIVPPAAEKRSTLKPSKTLAKIDTGDDNDDKPHFSSRSATPGSGGSADSKPGSSPTASTPADDPDRPTMRRHSDSSDTTASTGSGSSGSTPADDPDRPSLRRRSPDAAKKAQDERDSVTPVANSLNDDPNRPVLHRGKPTSALNEQDIPKLSGLPGDQDLHQMVAVSDATDRSPHDFSRAWDDEGEHQAILGKLQAAARAQLAAYEAVNGGAPAAAAPAAPKAPAQGSHVANSKLRRGVAKETPPPPPEKLLDEQLTGYTLSYGGAATYVYFAHTDGLGPTLRYVTLVAQVNAQGEPEIAVKNVTDATHLDRTPRMKLVDAVDAEASNRASLLFELRAQNSRQFALYRVIGARAEQTFLTGSTQ
jgi:cytochrome c553